jgi:hypothetical protein
LNRYRSVPRKHHPLPLTRMVMDAPSPDFHARCSLKTNSKERSPFLDGASRWSQFRFLTLPHTGRLHGDRGDDPGNFPSLALRRLKLAVVATVTKPAVPDW